MKSSEGDCQPKELVPSSATCKPLILQEGPAAISNVQNANQPRAMSTGVGRFARKPVSLYTVCFEFYFLLSI